MSSMLVKTQAIQVSKTFHPPARPTIHSATVFPMPLTFHHRTRRRQRFTATAPLTFPSVVFTYVSSDLMQFSLLNPLGEFPSEPFYQCFLFNHCSTLGSQNTKQKTNSEIFLQHGNLKLFPAGQLNSPSTDHDLWQPEGQDSATQSACGIPDNAFSISKVAIHPYFLKYADLSRKLEHLSPNPEIK